MDGKASTHAVDGPDDTSANEASNLIPTWAMAKKELTNNRRCA